MSEPSEKDIQLVGAFVGRLLCSLATEKALSVGMADLPVMNAMKRIPIKSYRRVIKSVVAQPGVAEFLLQAMAEGQK